MNKIVDYRVDNQIYYGELKTGTVFLLNNELYIKTDILEDDCVNDFYGINLKDGTKYPIGNKCIVIPVEIVIHITKNK